MMLKLPTQIDTEGEARKHMYGLCTYTQVSGLTQTDINSYASWKLYVVLSCMFSPTHLGSSGKHGLAWALNSCLKWSNAGTDLDCGTVGLNSFNPFCFLTFTF